MGYFEYVATCLFGLERLVGDEIDKLGYKRLETTDGRILFSGDESAAARFNVFSRYAERLYIKLGDFAAGSFTELFDGTRALPVECFIEENDAFPVTGSSIRSKLHSIPDCQKIIKKAIVEKLKESYPVNTFSESGTVVPIEFFIDRDVCTLMIDTSGDPLHKRGYRPVSNAAPLRETLAAAMVKLARHYPDTQVWDPFCGSGTIAIEAAMMLTNRAPGLTRGFTAESFDFIDGSAWKLAREEARDRVKAADITVLASDIDGRCVSLTAANAKRAGVSANIKAFVMDARSFKPKAPRGKIICNPPYGERLSERKEIEKLYADMGRAFSAADGWQAYIISSVQDFERLYGKKADKVRKMYNGRLKCNYYQYYK